MDRYDNDREDDDNHQDTATVERHVISRPWIHSQHHHHHSNDKMMLNDGMEQCHDDNDESSNAEHDDLEHDHDRDHEEFQEKQLWLWKQYRKRLQLQQQEYQLEQVRKQFTEQRTILEQHYHRQLQFQQQIVLLQQQHQQDEGRHRRVPSHHHHNRDDDDDIMVTKHPSSSQTSTGEEKLLSGITTASLTPPSSNTSSSHRHHRATSTGKDMDRIVPLPKQQQQQQQQPKQDEEQKHQIPLHQNHHHLAQQAQYQPPQQLQKKLPQQQQETLLPLPKIIETTKGGHEESHDGMELEIPPTNATMPIPLQIQEEANTISHKPINAPIGTEEEVRATRYIVEPYDMRISNEEKLTCDVFDIDSINSSENHSSSQTYHDSQYHSSNSSRNAPTLIRPKPYYSNQIGVIVLNIVTRRREYYDVIVERHYSRGSYHPIPMDIIDENHYYHPTYQQHKHQHQQQHHDHAPPQQVEPPWNLDDLNQFLLSHHINQPRRRDDDDDNHNNEYDEEKYMSDTDDSSSSQSHHERYQEEPIPSNHQMLVLEDPPLEGMDQLHHPNSNSQEECAMVVNRHDHVHGTVDMLNFTNHDTEDNDAFNRIDTNNDTVDRTEEAALIQNQVVDEIQQEGGNDLVRHDQNALPPIGTTMNVTNNMDLCTAETTITKAIVHNVMVDRLPYEKQQHPVLSSTILFRPQAVRVGDLISTPSQQQQQQQQLNIDVEEDAAMEKRPLHISQDNNSMCIDYEQYRIDHNMNRFSSSCSNQKNGGGSSGSSSSSSSSSTTVSSIAEGSRKSHDNRTYVSLTSMEIEVRTSKKQSVNDMWTQEQSMAHAEQQNDDNNNSRDDHLSSHSTPSSLTSVHSTSSTSS